MAKKVIKQLKIDNQLTKRHSNDLQNDLNFICTKIYEDVIKEKQEFRLKSPKKATEESDGVTFHSKVSFNPDIEIAQFDPTILPVVKANLQQKIPQSSLATKKFTFEKYAEKLASV